jgi:hypothetical protein
MVGMALWLYAEKRFGHGATAGAPRLSSVETFHNGIASEWRRATDGDDEAPASDSGPLRLLLP